MSDSRRWRQFGRIALLAGGYVATGKLGLMLASVNPSATAVWAPTGIALASFLLLGYRVWPGILLGAFLANVTTAGTVGTSIGIALGNTLEGLWGAYLVNRFARGRDAFDRPGDILRFVVLAGLLSTTVSATFGVTTLALRGFASWADYGSVWLTWWLGDAGGDLLVAPLLVLWSARPLPRWSRRQALEAVLLLLTLVLVGGVVLDGFLPQIGRYRLHFACVPLLIWPAFRFGRRETVTASFLLSGIAIWGTLEGVGPFLDRSRNESLLLLQGFMGILTFTALVLAAVVAERRRAQEALARHASELARSNAELERFAYVASHDLQEPLRTVTSFVQLLAKRYEAKLDEDARDFIRFAVEGTARMRDLIQGLLAYSRAGAVTGLPVPVDCGEALEKAIANLSVSIRDSGAAVTHDEMPKIVADGRQMVELFQNLVGNAIKFRGEKRPEVHVGVQRDGGAWILSVRDNGIGIAPEHWKRIFVMYQRLHRRDEYPGTGIGLAICDKIVRRHGGRIWVDSEPGKGSTFYFTLPLGATAQEGFGPPSSAGAG
jgi:signal transduction histidine kinase